MPSYAMSEKNETPESFISRILSWEMIVGTYLKLIQDI